MAEDTKFLFPSPVSSESAIDGHALAVAMRRLGESDKLTGRGSNTWKAEPPTPHDLRRTFSTRLSSLGVPKEDRDACMNHIPNDVGSKHYDLYDRLSEKRAAVDLWADRLKIILKGDHDERTKNTEKKAARENASTSHKNLGHSNR